MTSLCDMSIRLRWLVIAAALALLSPAIPWGVDATSSVPGSGQIASVVLSWNPKLGPERAARVEDAVQRCTRDQSLAPQVVLAVMYVESGARPEARSPKGAIGLMQVMPHMFDTLDLPGSVAHLETNVEAGCILLADNIGRLGEEDGISAYFWGSRIRGDRYLRRVQAVLDEVSAELVTEDLRSRG